MDDILPVLRYFIRIVDESDTVPGDYEIAGRHDIVNKVGLYLSFRKAFPGMKPYQAP